MSKQRLSPQPDLRRYTLQQTLSLQNVSSVTCSGSHCPSRSTKPVPSTGDGNCPKGVEIISFEKPKDMIPPSTLPQSGCTVQETKATMANVLSCASKNGCPISSVTKGENSQVADDFFAGKNAECHQSDSELQEFHDAKEYVDEYCNAGSDHSVSDTFHGTSVTSIEESASEAVSASNVASLDDRSNQSCGFSTPLDNRSCGTSETDIGLPICPLAIWDSLAHDGFPLCAESRCPSDRPTDRPESACCNLPVKLEPQLCLESVACGSTASLGSILDKNHSAVLPCKLGTGTTKGSESASSSACVGPVPVVSSNEPEVEHADVETKEGVLVNEKAEDATSNVVDMPEASKDMQSPVGAFPSDSEEKHCVALLKSELFSTDIIDLDGIVLEDATCSTWKETDAEPKCIANSEAPVEAKSVEIEATKKHKIANEATQESKFVASNEADQEPKSSALNELKSFVDCATAAQSVAVNEAIQESKDFSEPNALKLPETPIGEPKPSNLGSGNNHSISSEVTNSVPSTSKSSPEGVKDKSVTLKEKALQKNKDLAKLQQSSASGESKGLPSCVKQDGKRRYDRAFLLKLQTRPLCLKKPEGLPRIRIVKNSITRVKPFEPRPSGRAVRAINNFQDYGPCYIMSSAPRGSSPMYVQHTVYPVSLQNDSIYVPDGPFGQYDYDGPSSHCTTVYYYQPMVDLPPFSPSTQQLPVKQRKLIRIQDPITERDITEEILGAG